MSNFPNTAPQRHKKILMILMAVIAFMITLSYVSVPLYRLFCQTTGYGGTTQQTTQHANLIIDRNMLVRFNADLEPGMFWEFEPIQKTINVKVGEEALVYFRAKNISTEPITGTAVYNVTPLNMGSYFSKLECFCFQEQTLNPGQEILMPVVFYIDPEIQNNKLLNDVKTVTLSYTFYVTK